MRFLLIVMFCRFALQAETFAVRWKTLNEQALAASGQNRVAVLRDMNELVPGNARLILALANALGPGEESERLQKQLAAPSSQITAATRKLTLPGQDWIAEDLASHGKGFLVSSVTQAAIFNSNGSTFANTDLSVFGIARDQKQGLLWAALAWTPYCKVCRSDQKGQGALLAFDLKSAALKYRMDTVELGDLTVSNSGDVYVTSNSAGAVFVLPRGARQLQKLSEDGEFPSPQSPVLSKDSNTLYVADYRRGIAALDLKSKRWTWLRPGPGVIVNGIDGLYVTRDSFLAIQNGVSPVRIVKLSLDLQRQQVLEANWPGLGEPTHGTVRDNSFCFLANTGWDAFSPDGTRKPTAPPVVTTIHCRPLP